MNNYEKTIENIRNLIIRDYPLVGKSMKESDTVTLFTGMVSERKCGNIGISFFAEALTGELTIEMFFDYCPKEYMCQTSEYLIRINNLIDNGLYKLKSNGSIEYKIKASFAKGELTEDEIDEIIMKSIINIRREKRNIRKLSSGRTLLPGDYTFEPDYMDNIKLPLSFMPDIKNTKIKSLKDLKIIPTVEEFKSFEDDFKRIVDGEENDGFKDNDDTEKDDFEPFANLESLYNENEEENDEKNK